MPNGSQRRDVVVWECIYVTMIGSDSGDERLVELQKARRQSVQFSYPKVGVKLIDIFLDFDFV